MARNRKRAKERRSRRPDPGLSRPGVATARPGRDQPGHDDAPRAPIGRPDAQMPIEHDDPALTIQPEETPSAIEHGTPDVELANAQLALGRPDLAGEPAFGDFDPDRAGGEGFEPDGPPADGGGASGGGGLTGPGSGSPSGGAGLPASRGVPGNRLINFLQGSWRELQRVQWPDRRQVMQATGVVIGFVIVAGVFLGVADALATKLVNYILK